MRIKLAMMIMFVYVLSVVVFGAGTSGEYKFVSGSNVDPNAGAEGERPYEMAERTEAYSPVVTFEDCEKWMLSYRGVDAGLYRSNEQKMWRDVCGKLVFTATADDSEMILKLKDPVVISEPWDCLAMWAYGHRWHWTDQKTEPLELEFLLEDANGKEQRIRFQSYYKGAINHKDWFLMRVKVHAEIPRPCTLTGIRLWGEKVTLEAEEKAIYLGPIYAYKEVLKPMKFEPWPDELPFPVKGKSILPTNKNDSFRNYVEAGDDDYHLNYHTEETDITYYIRPVRGSLGEINVSYNGKKAFCLCKDSRIKCIEENAKWDRISERIVDDKLITTWKVVAGDITKTIQVIYSIQHKSLIIEMEEIGDGPGIVEAIELGHAKTFTDAKLIEIPFLNYNYAHSPRALYHDGLFVFSQFDWYTSQASELFEGEIGIDGDNAVFNGGAKYIPKTDGLRNSMKERLFINVSPDFQEVLPSIPNPPSPMKEMMGHRCWLVINVYGYEQRLAIPKKFRALGIEHMAVRYHEPVWADVGESFTFKTTAAPKQGGDEALKKLVADIKSLGWLCGLYSNYTDFVTQNPHWDEDWLLLNRYGDWLPSWFRCYAPKPMIGVEQQKNFSPVIHEKFGTNHCYSDVHTAVPVFDRVDYDARVPGAGTFRRTYECYGRVLLGERAAHKGPIFSEGNHHWLYAGLCDGNYANAWPILNKQMLLVDFDLLKMHPLQMDALTNNMPLDEQVAYGLAYAHIGQLIPHDVAGSMKIYYMLQPLQSYYTMILVKDIYYHDGSRYVDTSEALKFGGIDKKRVHVVFENGFKYWVNLGSDDWTVITEKGRFTLPTTGLVGFSPDEKAMSVSIFVSTEDQKEKKRVDYSYGPESIYFDSRGSDISYGIFEGKGSAVLKKEANGWELIPADDFSQMIFDLKAIDLDGKDVAVLMLDEEGKELGLASFEVRDGKLQVARDRKDIFKYGIREVLTEK